MKMKKLLISLMVLLISAFTFGGCAKLNYYRVVDGNNVIIDRLEIELDGQKISASGNSLENIKDIVENDMRMFRISVEEWKQQFISFPDLYTKLEKGIVCTDAVVSNTKFTLTITFANIQMFGLFYGMSNVKDENDENFEYKKAMEDVGPFIYNILTSENTIEDAGLFMQKYSVIKDVSVFENIDKLKIAGENINDRYRRLTNYAFSLDDVNLSQFFYYPDTSLYSNADAKHVEKGITMLQWNFSNKEDGFQMEIYKLAPKPYAWYILGLVLSAIAIVIVIIIIKKKANSNVIKVSKEEVESNER